MKIHQIFTANSLRNFSYVIEFNSKAIIIDPFYANQMLDFINKKNLELVAIINTHEHFDHIQGNEEIKKKTNCEIWAHENAKGKIPQVDRLLRKREIIELDKNSKLEVMDTPGHTFAHLCLKIIQNNEPIGVITGDTLFNAGVGNCNSGDAKALFDTIYNQFLELPEYVKVYPGHEYIINNCKFTLSIEPENSRAKEILEEQKKLIENNSFLVTDMKTEREINTFFRLGNNSIREKLFENKAQEVNNEKVFLELRRRRDSW